MEKFKFILKNSYGIGADYVCKYLPENIQGLKISKKTSVQVPVGYTIESSFETIKLVKDDADILRKNFFQNGINAVQICELQYLNEMATDYDTVFESFVDFQNMKVTTSFVEFGININAEQTKFKETSGKEISIAPN